MYRFICLSVIAVLAWTAQAPAQFRWDAEVNVSDWEGGRDYATSNNTRFIALFGDTVYIPWERWVEDDTVPGAAIARWTPDNGATWGTEIDLSLLFGAEGHYISFVVSSNGVGHILARSSTSTDYYRSTNSGQSWDNRFSEGFLTSNFSSLAVEDNMVHTVLPTIGFPTASYQYKRSLDNGLNWEATEELATTNSMMAISSIAVCGDNVYLAYTVGSMWEDTVCFIRSTNGGVDWSSPTVLGTASLLVGGAFPCVACRYKYVYVAWNGGTIFSKKINFRRSTDWGATWKGTQDLGDGQFPNLFALDINVYMAYAHSDGTLYLNRSENAGASWVGAEQVSATAEIGYAPGPTIIVEADSNAHIAWTDKRFVAEGDTNVEIFYIHGEVPVVVGKEERCGDKNPFPFITCFYETRRILNSLRG